MRQLRNFLNLTTGDRLLLLSTLVLLAILRLGLWLLPFKTLLALLPRLSQITFTPNLSHPILLNKVIWAVNVSSRYMPGGVKCLARALTTKVLLDRLEHPPELRIGVAKGDQGTLEAHAWVEYQGQIIIGNLRDLSRFVPLPAFQGVRP
jgi:hypothetical protein